MPWSKTWVVVSGARRPPSQPN